MTKQRRSTRPRAGFARAALRACGLFAAASVAAACQRAKALHVSSAVAQSTASGGPAIDSVRPDSVLVPRGAVVEVVIHGHGFAPGMPGANTIHFAGMAIAQVPANAAGTVIHFVIPDVVTSRSEAPPLPLDAGAYALTIETGGGTSNAVTLRVFR
ncbi:MAG: hypothetical protein ACHQWU_12405 [Gemmatimonadales bacterium]